MWNQQENPFDIFVVTFILLLLNIDNIFHCNFQHCCISFVTRQANMWLFITLKDTPSLFSILYQNRTCISSLFEMNHYPQQYI